MRGAPSPIEPIRFGKYALVAKLAEGGMAQIFLGVEQTPVAGCRFVSVKRIHPDCCADRSFLEYFLTEARVSLKCFHPNLPHVYELGDVDGVPYLALEYIRGVTLLDLFRAARRSHRHLSVALTLNVAAGVAAALQHLHELTDVDGSPLRCIHRDVTPANLMVGYEGHVKLIDLGIVHTTLQTHRTATGILKGKFAYQAPEQIENPALVDHRADLFMLGIVMHETLCGRPLFHGRDNRETLLKVLREPIPDPAAVRPDLPPELSAVLFRALERDPQNRYSSAGELLYDLERVAQRVGVSRSPLWLKGEVLDLCGAAAQTALPSDRMVTLVQPMPSLASADSPVAGAHGGDSDYEVEVEWEDEAGENSQRTLPPREFPVIGSGTGGMPTTPTITLAPGYAPSPAMGRTTALGPAVEPRPPTSDPEFDALLRLLKL